MQNSKWIFHPSLILISLLSLCFISMTSLHPCLNLCTSRNSFWISHIHDSHFFKSFLHRNGPFKVSLDFLCIQSSTYKSNYLKLGLMQKREYNAFVFLDFHILLSKFFLVLSIYVWIKVFIFNFINSIMHVYHIFINESSMYRYQDWSHCLAIGTITAVNTDVKVSTRM